MSKGKKITLDDLQKKLDVYGLKIVSEFKNISKSATLECSFCGTPFFIKNLYNFLKKKKNKSCGCVRTEYSNSSRYENQKFGKLLVIKELSNERDKHGERLWECECKCGNKIIVPNHVLKEGTTKSCGDYRCNIKFSGYMDISGTYWNIVKRSARDRNLVFEITIKDAWDQFIKQDKRCALTGESLIFASKRNQRNQTASLDRIDSKRGYTTDNIQWTHKEINIMKWSLGEEKFLEYIKRIYNHRIKNNILYQPEFEI